MAEEIHIRNMVCGRCIMAVRKIFRDAGIEPLEVELGTVLLEQPLERQQRELIGRSLEEYGFGLIDDRRSRMLERIKTAVIELVHYGGEPANAGLPGRVNLSGYLSEKCHADYSSLSKLFSEMKGESIEKYYIAQRIERVKEFLVCDELSVGEIADIMGYSSPAHLSAQFKSVTGLSPREFKALKTKPLLPLDKI